jgi:hypothetical protein
MKPAQQLDYIRDLDRMRNLALLQGFQHVYKAYNQELIREARRLYPEKFEESRKSKKD